MISYQQLYNDLLFAYFDAIKHKSKKWYVIDFAKDLHNNISQLAKELYTRTYKHSPFTVYILKPFPREVFAAQFRDRVVHHLYFNYVHELFERTFIEDSYSCIKGKGTTYGIDRLKHHILSASDNYTKTCYALKIDIKAYFININRPTLLSIILHKLQKFKKSPKNSNIDFDFVEYLTREIVLTDPTKNAEIYNVDAYVMYKKSKSVFFAKPDCGIPIGNLTSQLFSNIYLNEFDQFIKRVLKCKHYGRDVDDGYIIHQDKSFLLNLLPSIDDFLYKTLGLHLNKGKTIIKNVKYGIEFLGAYIKPYRMYISNKTLYRMYKRDFPKDKVELINSIVSRFGLLKRYSSYNIRQDMLNRIFTN